MISAVASNIYALTLQPITHHPGFFPPHSALVEYSSSPEVECMHDDGNQVHLILKSPRGRIVSVKVFSGEYGCSRVPGVHALHLQLGSVIRRLYLVSLITNHRGFWSQCTSFVPNGNIQIYRPWIFSIIILEEKP